MAANNAPVQRAQIVQVGYETTPGTGVAATRAVDMVAGGAIFTPKHTPILVPQAGDLNENVFVYQGLSGGELVIPMNSSYDDAPYWDNLIGVPVTAGVGGAAPYAYAIIPSKTDPSTQKIITAEIGGVGAPAWPSEFQMVGLACAKREIDFTKGQLWQDKVTLVAGGAITPQAKTGALSARAVTHIRTQDTKVYLNAIASAFGNTQLVTRMVQGNLAWETGADPRQTFDGTGDPSLVAIVGPFKLSGRLRLHFSALTEYTNWKAGTPLRCRVEATGPVLGAGNYKRTIDMGIVIGDWRPVYDRGLHLVEFPFVGIEDSSIASQIKFNTLNNSSSIAA